MLVSTLMKLTPVGLNLAFRGELTQFNATLKFRVGAFIAGSLNVDIFFYFEFSDSLDLIIPLFLKENQLTRIH